ncbi:hypothetical protein FDB55_13200 [Clostridium botulinum]|uniref:Uncharacterized protein n=1 Tax=Clostridium botulinum TaxID=1491 RepID=A0A6B4JHI2_CLOBO|nr:hypothetical protein [Clostridium botulinum]MBY6759737.1 hypothetical protein [Clostridium botulinum]MBY6918646.1 hypothetical protein [Clostridium botulinum]NFG27711.1 hypothetical protein [Clostridium botulinum]NFJ56454.1 hypothetical protein [Clostridium botulinum]
MTILAMAKQFNQRPSQVINLTNDYEAFCFDEACVYIMSEMNKEDAQEPRFENDTPRNNDDLIEYFKSNN